MPLLENDTFNFSQFYVLDLNKSDGWCAGISVSMMIYLKECFPQMTDNYPLDGVFQRTKEYADMLRMSFNSFEGKTTLGTEDFRGNMEKFQSAYMYNFGVPGKWEYQFDKNGVFLLNLKSSDSHQQVGSQFSKFYDFWGSSDHAGFLVTGNSNRFFVFDPNAGGGIFSWTQCSDIKNITCAVDKALDRLYQKNDRLRGRRIVRLKAAKRLDFSSSRYHHAV